TRHPTARSLLHLRLARAQAALGEAHACRRSLATAEQDMARAEGDAPAWCSWMSPADLLVDSGRCLLDLGHPERAHALIEEGTAMLPGARDKTRAVFLSYEAGSFLQRGEADQAAAAAMHSLTLAKKIGAPRCIALVRDLAPGFNGHAGVHGVDELLELVHAS
ncbi:XRE family transcriptional regulator, partial [Streptomyces sp. NPDC002589]